MGRDKKSPAKTNDASDRVTFSLSRLSTSNLSTTFLLLFTFVTGLLMGSLYTKVQYLEKGTGSQQAAVNTGGTAPTAPGAPSAPQVVDVEAGSLPLFGDENAKVTIVEFSDFQCPFCRSFYKDTYKQLKTKYLDTGKAKLSYRHFPLDFHPAAHVSAQAAECANDQGKFWEFHDLLFEKQSAKGQGTIQYTADDLKTWTAELNIDTAAFNQCLDSGKYKQKVDDDMAYAQTAGVAATPTFFINGQKLEGAQPFSVFKTMIDQELAK